jgi:hypothetical protein
MSVLDESVRRVLQVDGARAAVLIDAGTAMIVGSAGELSPGLSEAAVSMAQEVRAAAGAGGPDLPDGALEEIAVMTRQRYQLIEVLELRRGEGLLLFVDVDRSQTNVAFAGWQVRQLMSGLLA